MGSRKDVLIGLSAFLAAVGLAVIFGPGEHHPFWRYVGIAGVVAGGLILICLLLPRPSSYVTDEHETQLRMMLDGVTDALDSHRVIGRAESQFPDDLSRIFQAHFPDVVEAAQPWNDAVIRDEQARVALGQRATAEVERASFAGDGRYANEPIARGIATITAARAESQQLQDSLDLTLPDPVRNPQPVWRLRIVAGLEFLHLGDDEGWAINVTSAGVADLVAPVNQLLTHAQRWTEAKELQAAHLDLQSFDQSRIRDSARTEGAQYAFKRARRCPECRKH